MSKNAQLVAAFGGDTVRVYKHKKGFLIETKVFDPAGDSTTLVDLDKTQALSLARVLGDI